MYLTYAGMRRAGCAAAIGGLAVALVAIPASAAPAPKSNCKIVDSKHTYTSLSTAVNAASNGDTLTVSGTCTGQTADLTQAITLTITAKGKNPTLSSGGAGPIMSVVSSGATVTINGLVITGGVNTDGTGGALENFGTLTLNNTTVTGNTATDSGGAAIGGGIYNNGSLTLNSSTVSNNTAASSAGGEGHGGGIYNEASGTITLNNSSVTGNTAGGPSSDYGFGGGIYVGGGTVTLAGTTTVTANTATGTNEGLGGGVFIQSGTGATLNGATDGGNVSGNTPDNIVTA